MKARIPTGRDRQPRQRCRCCGGPLPLRHYRLLVDGAVWHLCASDYRAVIAQRGDE